MKYKILITGTAGFIGFHLAEALIAGGHEVVGIDNINDYYEVNLKFARLRESGIGLQAQNWNSVVQSTKYYNYRFVRMNLEDKGLLMDLFAKESFDIIINLAAQAGVRHSIKFPDVYIQSNIVGFSNILEASRHYPIKHLLYASSSSIYGLNSKVPFSTEDRTDHPISLYAATKRSNELMAHSYSHLYGIPITGLRFFTVYGAWGRPDMAYFSFADSIKKGKPIKVFNHGKLERDFTYIDDIVSGILSVVNHGLEGRQLCEVYNLGNNKPVRLLDFILEIEKNIGKVAIKEYVDMQPGDVLATWADIEPMSKLYGYSPKTSLDIGIRKFVEWFQSYERAND